MFTQVYTEVHKQKCLCGHFFLEPLLGLQAAPEQCPHMWPVPPTPPPHTRAMGPSETQKEGSRISPVQNLLGPHRLEWVLLQSLLASVLSPFMLLRECPLTFQDPVKTHVLYKTFPNQSIQLPSQQAEVTPCHIFQKHCDPMLRLLSTGRKAPVSRMPANRLCMPSFSPKHLVYNNTHQMFDDLTS